MTTENISELPDRIEWLSGLPAFPSLAPDAWREVERRTARVLSELHGASLPPGSVESFYSYGILLYDRGDDCGSSEVWEALVPHAKAAGRNDVAAYCAARIAQASLFFGEAKEALIWCRRGRLWAKAVPSRHPLHGRLAATLGTIYQHRREWSNAQKAYRKALKFSDVDPGLALQWEGMNIEDLKTVRLTALVDCLLREARLEGRSQDLLLRAERILQDAQEQAASFFTRCHCQFNMVELLWIRGDLDAAETLAAGLSSLLDNPAFPERTRLRFRPALYWIMSLFALSQDNLIQAQQHMREAFRWMRARRNPLVEALIVPEMIGLFATAHRKYYGGYREDTVLSTLEDNGAWLMSLVDFCESMSPFLLGGHSRNVEIACRILTDHLETQESGTMPPLLEATYLRGAALLHDIGLLKTSWALVNRVRPSRPVDEKRLQSHALAGGRILEQLGFPMTARLAEEHHEFADGSGYPFGTRRQTEIGGILSLAEALVTSCSPDYGSTEPLSVDSAIHLCLGPNASRFQPRALQALKRAADACAFTPLKTALS